MRETALWSEGVKHTLDDCFQNYFIHSSFALKWYYFYLSTNHYTAVHFKPANQLQLFVFSGSFECFSLVDSLIELDEILFVDTRTD